MDFEFYDPNENQARSIRNLINPYAMELKDLDTNEMANAIVTQNVGVMLGCPDDEEESKEQKNKGIYDKEIFAFVSVLNVGFYSTRTKFMPCIIKKWRELAASSGSSNAEKLLKLLEPGNLPKVCLMLAQRLLNVPSQLIPTLYEQFTEDLLWVAQNDKEESPKYNVDWVVYMVRGQKHFVKGAKGGNKKKQGGSPGGSYEFVCSKFEDEVFLKGAEYTVELGSTSTKQAAGGTVIEEPVPSVPVVKMVKLSFLALNKFSCFISRIQPNRFVF